MTVEPKRSAPAAADRAERLALQLLDCILLNGVSFMRFDKERAASLIRTAIEEAVRDHDAEWMLALFGDAREPVAPAIAVTKYNEITEAATTSKIAMAKDSSRHKHQAALALNACGHRMADWVEPDYPTMDENDKQMMRFHLGYCKACRERDEAEQRGYQRGLAEGEKL